MEYYWEVGVALSELFMLDCFGHHLTDKWITRYDVISFSKKRRQLDNRA